MNYPNIILRKSILLSTFVFGSVTGGVLAQDQPALEEIIVTAQKRSESVLDVAAAITVITGDELAFRDLTNADDISQSVPNLEYGNVSGASQITIRGIGLNVETGFAEPAVAVHLNGVYLGRANAAALGLSDLAGVEVLRGPQGTLYGRNATGGVVNFMTNKPTGEFEAGVTLGAGSFDKWYGHGYVSGSLSDSVRGRLFAEYTDDDGYIDNRTTGKDEGGVEATTAKGDISWDIADSVTADLTYLYIDQDWHGPSFEKLVPGNFGAIAGFDPKPNSILNDVDPWSEIDMQVASLNVTWDADNFTMTSITGYVDFQREDYLDGDQTSLDIATSGRDEDSESWSQEFNVGGNYRDRLDWVAGVFFLHEDSSARTDVDMGEYGKIALGPFESLALNNLEEEIDAFGVFIDGTYAVTETVRVKAGLRYSDEEKKGNQTVINFDGAFTLCDNLKSKVSYDDVSPKLGAEWDAAENVMAYGTYQQGFKSGGYNQSGCEAFDPEEVDSYEIGLKGSFLEDRMHASVAGFYYDYTELQVLQVRNLVGFVDNAADSEVYGVEFETKYLFTEDLIGELALSWLDATYETFIDGGGNDYSGNRLSRAPEYTAFGALEYIIPIQSSGLGDVRLRGEGYWSDDVYYRPANGPDDIQDSYTLVNFYASLSSQSERFQVKAFVKNASDEEYLLSIVSLLDGLDGHYAMPRNWGLEISAKW
jgi:iron complex outermembrane recepter protein